MWGGRYFTEEKLIFGCTSSPSIYIQTTMVPRQIAAKHSGMNLTMVAQCVDDVIPISHAGDSKVESFIKKYREVCREMGVRLATNEGGNTPDKCFDITNSGVLLGVEFDSNRCPYCIAARVRSRRNVSRELREWSEEIKRCRREGLNIRNLRRR